MPANPWELRADARPLERGARRWEEIATLMSRRGDEIVDAARRATDGWDAAAAESYDSHRRQVLANLDRFTQLASQIAGSLRAVSALIASTQKELDQAWTKVALVPHDVVGESRHLVFRPTEDEDRGKITRGQEETDEIRRRLATSLDQESTRLRSARAEFVMVRTELTTLSGGTLPGELTLGQDVSGVGTVPPPSTSVRGSAQSGMPGVSGVSGLPPIAPISVSVPDLTGLSPAGLAPFMAAAASGISGRRGAGRTTSATPPMGGMGAGAMGARGGTMSRGMASGRSGPSRIASPRLAGCADREAPRGAGDVTGAKAGDKGGIRQSEKEAEKEAKRAAIADKRAARAARKAERESGKREQETPDSPEPTDEDGDSGTDHRVDLDPDAETGAEDESPRR